MRTLIKICILALATTPLVVDSEVFFPFISGKSFLMQICLVVATILFLTNYFYSKEFRLETTQRVKILVKNPLTVALTGFVVSVIISTFFAFDKYVAFWGELNRAEGLTGLIFLFSIFMFGLLVFEKKDWLWFLKISLFVSTIVVFKQFQEFSNGLIRPGSFFGNPTFLAGYSLFSITSAIIVFGEEKSLFWKYFSVFVGIISIFGIFLAETRGTILGLAFGFAIILIYFAIKGGEVEYKKINLQKVAIVLLSIGIIFSGIFAITRKSEFWQNVPGLSRLAITSAGDVEDLSMEVRLLVYKSALKSIDPSQDNLKNLLIGWGPENFINVDIKYYDAKLFEYEQAWHDRAHNKFLDILVMNGVLGLILYVLVWFFFFRTVLKNQNFSLRNVGLLFLGSAFLTHILFVFDDISSQIFFFVILGMIVYSSEIENMEQGKKLSKNIEIDEKFRIISIGLIVLLTCFLVFVFLKNTLPGYLQMKKYHSLIVSSDVIKLQKEIDSVFNPFTTAQKNIRLNFVDSASTLYEKDRTDASKALLEKSFSMTDEYVEKRPLDFNFLARIAEFYNKSGISLKNIDYLQKSEEYFRRVSEFAPNRPDMILGLGINLYSQERYNESFATLEKAFDLTPLSFAQHQNAFVGIYTKFIQYFYETRDLESFIKTADRLKQNNYSNFGQLDAIINYLEEKGEWPIVNFK